MSELHKITSGARIEAIDAKALGAYLNATKDAEFSAKYAGAKEREASCGRS